MAGHSKWANIRFRKGAQDARRGKLFTKLIREITVAARTGGEDATSNPRLRAAIDKALSNNMPKDNIERAIKKGLGATDGEAYDEVVYEGYGPGGTAIYVETLTDNKNRTVGELRHILTKYGGNLGSSGCVAYLFEKKGIISFDRAGINLDALLEVALEAGADDLDEGADSVDVLTRPGNFETVRDALVAKGFRPVSAEISMEPSSVVQLQGEEAETMLRVADALEDLEDVQNVYANFDISEEEMARIAG